MLGGEFIGYAKRHNVDLMKPFLSVDGQISKADIFFVNLEGPISAGPEERHDVKTLLSNDISVLEFLTRYKICIANLGNNHIMDYGQNGLDRTISLLKKNGVFFLGAGRNYDEAARELIIDSNGIVVAFSAFTSAEENVKSVIAEDGKAGCASFLRITDAVSRIHKLKKEVDIICVSLHWGHEYFLYPSYEQVKLARQLVDAGATYVVGHHPHVVQGIEKYRDSMIIYSLGNFFMPPVRNIFGRLGFSKLISTEGILVQSEAEAGRIIGTEVIGGRLSEGYGWRQFKNDEQRHFLQKLRALSKPIVQADYHNFWRRYKLKREHELEKESLIEAFKKIKLMSLRDVIHTITINDVIRNLVRVVNIIMKKRAFKADRYC